MIDVDLRDVEHLHMVMTALEAETDVAEIARHRDPKRKPGAVAAAQVSWAVVPGGDDSGALAP